MFSTRHNSMPTTPLRWRNVQNLEFVENRYICWSFILKLFSSFEFGVNYSGHLKRATILNYSFFNGGAIKANSPTWKKLGSQIGSRILA